MNRSNKLGYVILGIVALATILSVFVLAETNYPYGAREVTYLTSERSNVSRYPPEFVDSEAGNVTELSLVGISVTRNWQGYFGNITGQITLEDASGNVFYNWSALEPKGMVFAAINGSVSWGGVRCFNWSDYGYQGIDLEGEETRLRIGDDEADGINETFYEPGLESDLFVGSLNITGNATDLGITCHTTNPFQLGSQNSNLDNFENFLLTDGAGALVFSTVIENDDYNNQTDIIGFNGNTYDFQLMVLEDGHNGHEDITTRYYFWLQLE